MWANLAGAVGYVAGWALLLVFMAGAGLGLVAAGLLLFKGKGE